MAKALSLGNGQILVNLDARGQVRDFYFPYVGLENHVGGELVHRLGVWVDGELAWTDHPEWQIKVESEPEALAGRTVARHERLGVELHLTDLVYNEKNIFVRKIFVTNLADRAREIKLFFSQQFEMYQSRMAHTAYYDPAARALIHYRNARVFVANAELAGRGFNQFTTGVFLSEGKEGSHLDAVDGLLSDNPIEHGRADSVLGLTNNFGPGERQTLYYWLTVGRSIKEALNLDRDVRERGPGHLVETTLNYWQAWVNRQNFSFTGLSPEMVSLFKRSLFLVRAHANPNGAIIASCDFTTLQQGKDTYNYVWPRDASYAAIALARAGDDQTARSFFNFAAEVINEHGFFMHKYCPDRSLGSSWHPWLRNGRPELPIQEDETALVLFHLWQYYEITKDLEFIEAAYNKLIKPAADFMILYRHERTGLPKPSYDLWEEKFGTSTFSAAAVYGALSAAARFAKLLGKVKNEDLYRQTATEIQKAIIDHLYLEREGYFAKLLNLEGDKLLYDLTLDVSSIYGILYFGVLPSSDGRVKRALEWTRSRLGRTGLAGGLARYEGDRYLRQDQASPGNPWFVTTLWLAEQSIAAAKSEADLAEVKQALAWAVSHAQSSGLLSEQLNPHSGEQLSVAPLVWSHAQYVLTVLSYLDKLEALGICKACNPVY